MVVRPASPRAFSSPRAPPLPRVEVPTTQAQRFDVGRRSEPGRVGTRLPGWRDYPASSAMPSNRSSATVRPDAVPLRCRLGRGTLDRPDASPRRESPALVSPRHAPLVCRGRHDRPLVDGHGRGDRARGIAPRTPGAGLAGLPRVQRGRRFPGDGYPRGLERGAAPGVAADARRRLQHGLGVRRALLPVRQRRGRRAAHRPGCRHRPGAVALDLSQPLRGLLRLQHRPSGQPGGGRGPGLHLRRGGTAAVSAGR